MFGQRGAVGEPSGTDFAFVRSLAAVDAHVRGDRRGLREPEGKINKTN